MLFNKIYIPYKYSYYVTKFLYQQEIILPDDDITSFYIAKG